MIVKNENGIVSRRIVCATACRCRVLLQKLLAWPQPEGQRLGDAANNADESVDQFSGHSPRSAFEINVEETQNRIVPVWNWWSSYSSGVIQKGWRWSCRPGQNCGLNSDRKRGA